MSQESRLLDLIVNWEELRAAGQEASPEVLCQDCPELLDELKERLEALEQVNGVLALSGSQAARPAGKTTFPLSKPLFPTDTGSAGTWLTDGQFEILAELGRGGMGVVYKARQVPLGRIVAIKAIRGEGSIRPDQRQRFVREAKAMARLQHPNIVQIYEIHLEGECPFLVMEYVDGQSLADRLGGKPEAPAPAARLLAVVARAVHAAHEQGIIHRDLKPTNILLTADGAPKICDFGLARHLETPADHTRTGQLVGTPSYMAPEQILDESGVQGPAVDIYALGAVLYEMLTGRPVFLADNPLDTLQQVATQDPVPPRQWQPKIPRDLETICLKCLAKEPHRRYASALALAEDLERFLAGAPIHARPVGPLERALRWCRVYPARAALVGVVALALVTVLTMVSAFSWRLGRELQRTEEARQQVLSVQDRLRRTVSQEVADSLDGDLRELAAVPLTIASLLGSVRQLDERYLEGIMKEMLERSPLIFGLCVAFEPFSGQKDREDFALYVYRKGEGLAVKQLLPATYQPHYRQWEWYRAAKGQRQGRWSEPYIGEGADGTPMVTFSVPIEREGRFTGVVTADLAMDYFRNLRARVARLDLGPRGYCFMVSAGQRILVHPTERYQFPSQSARLEELPLDESIRARIASSRPGPPSLRGVDRPTGTPVSFLFSPIPAANWTLVTVVE